MTKYKMPSWASKQIVRWDRGGMVEDICEKHGCGHPNREWLASKSNRRKDGSIIDSGIHGCCGQCCKKKFWIPDLKNFKEIPGYPKYMINIDGDIWSKKTNKLMKPHEKDGYYFVQLRIDNKPKYASVHRLVALTWILNPDNLPEVNHRDFDRSNNNIANLEWVTTSQNTKHSYIAGRREKSREHCVNLAKDQRKFSINEIEKIRFEHDEGATYKFLGEKYSCHYETIARICRLQTYKDKN